MKALCELTLLENKQLARDLWLARFSAGDSSHLLVRVRAGMFTMIRCDEADELRFRRPFSFADVDAERCTFAVYYRVVGSQTQSLADYKEGEKLSAVLPLGNGFSLPEGNEDPVLVGGGIGVAPLLMLCRELERAGQRTPRFYFGSRCEEDLTRSYVEDFPAEFRFATDDGSFGYKGTIVDLLKNDGFGDTARIYACGPKPMLKALCSALPEHAQAEASLEEVMGCGIGACYGCAVRTTAAGVDETKLVCRDGPVFNLRGVSY